MSRLKVRFDEPEHGWIGFVLLCDGEAVVECHASHIYDSFRTLTMTLLTMLDERGEGTVTWLEEPAELEMLFQKRDETIRLELHRFRDHLRPLEARALFSFAGNYDEVCLPFWRALRGLEGCYSSQEWVRRWREPFPSRELTLLTERLGKS